MQNKALHILHIISTVKFFTKQKQKQNEDFKVVSNKK